MYSVASAENGLTSCTLIALYVTLIVHTNGQCDSHLASVTAEQ